MHAIQDIPEVLYIYTDEQSDVVAEMDTGECSVTAVRTSPTSSFVTDSESVIAEHDPDCLLLSDQIDLVAARDLVEQVSQRWPTLPVVAFAPETSAVEALVDAGITELIHTSAATAPVTLLERRLTTVLEGIDKDGDTEPLLFQEITEQINDVVWVNSLGDSGLDYVNSAYEAVWGRSPTHLYEDRTSLLETIHPEDRDHVREAMDQQLTHPEAYDVTYRIVRPDGEVRWVHSRAVGIRRRGEIDRIVGIATDITERKRNEQQLEEQRNELAELAHINRIIRSVDDALLGAETRTDVLQAVCDNLAATQRYHCAVALEFFGRQRLDATEWTTGASEFVETQFPMTGPAIEHGPAATALNTNETQVITDIADHPVLENASVDRLCAADISSLAAIPVVYEGTEYGVVYVFATAELGYNNRVVFDELGETVGHALAAVESRKREQTLTALYRATEQFLACETPQEVSDVVVETASDVLELPGFGVFLLDDETNHLSLRSGTDQLLDFFDETRVFGPGRTDSITWHTYITGETQYYDNVRKAERLANEDTAARSSLLIPLGKHGVFVAASTEVAAFDEPTRRLVGLLATTAEAALDRVTGQADIRARDAEIQSYQDQLDDIQTLLTVTQESTELLRESDTRAELESALCELITEQECVTFAWIGRQSPDDTALTPQVWAGSEDGYLDTVSFEQTTEPAVRATDTGDVETISNVTEQVHDSPWAREALDRGYQSILAVPLSYDGEQFGTLAVYCSEPEAFSEQATSVATHVGETIAFGLDARHSGLDGETTEMLVSLGQTDTALNQIAALADEHVSYREISSDGATVPVLCRLSDPPVSQILELETTLDTVESINHVECGEWDLFRVTVSGETVATVLRDCGTTPRALIATPTDTKASVGLPPEINRDDVLDSLQARYPGTTLVDRQNHDTDVHRELNNRLTTRQLEVLLTAYESGYFESPRTTTSEGVAQFLGVSQPTVTNHLREAQRRIFKIIFGSE
jgi:PAS domain S-box-containing protein